MALNPQAESLNNAIRDTCPAAFNLLSDRGKGIFFPKEGILAQAAEAKGKKINATIGIAVEDDGSPMRLKSIEKNINIEPQDAFTYAPSFGKTELRMKWQEMIFKKNPSLKNRISLPIVTNALTHGLSMAGYLFINPGDKIIIPDKYWGNYRLIFVNAYGAVLDTFNTFKADLFDIGSLKEKLNLTIGKKVILLNFPNNPTGYSLTENEAQEVADTVFECAEKGNEILVLCDDAYFGLVYKQGIYRESIFSKLSNLHENVLAVKLDGPTKEDYVWGFRVGFITYSAKGIGDKALKALESKTAGAVRGNISNSSHLAQSLLLRAFSSDSYTQEKEVKFSILKKRFDAVENALDDKKYDEYFTKLPFNSGYFMCIELKAGIDAENVRKRLLDGYETGVISTGNLLRIAFSSISEKVIKQLFDNIYHACIDCSKH